MAYRFNPPPQWPPVPEGWQPPPNWQPDPAWGSAPADWNYWVEETPVSSALQPGWGMPAPAAPDSGYYPDAATVGPVSLSSLEIPPNFSDTPGMPMEPARLPRQKRQPHQLHHPRRRNRLAWVLGSLAVVLIGVGVALAVWLLTGDSGTPNKTASSLPAGLDVTSVDTPVVVGDFMITMGPVADDGYTFARSVDSSIEAPRDGREYVIAEMTVKNNGDARAYSSSVVPLLYDSDENVVYVRNSRCEVGENSNGGVILRPGETVKFYRCLELPIGAADGGYWQGVVSDGKGGNLYFRFALE